MARAKKVVRRSLIKKVAILVVSLVMAIRSLIKKVVSLVVSLVMAIRSLIKKVAGKDGENQFKKDYPLDGGRRQLQKGNQKGQKGGSKGSKDGSNNFGNFGGKPKDGESGGKHGSDKKDGGESGGKHGSGKEGGEGKEPSEEVKAALAECRKNELFCKALLECKMKHKESGGKGGDGKGPVVKGLMIGV